MARDLPGPPKDAGGDRPFEGTRSGPGPDQKNPRSAADAADVAKRPPQPGTRLDGTPFPRHIDTPGREVRRSQDAAASTRETKEAVRKSQEANDRLAELVESYEELREVVKSLRGQLEEKDELNIILKDRMKQLQEQMDEVRKQRSENQPVTESSLDQIAGAIIRITIITLLGGAIGGPLMAAVTDGIVKVKIAEGLVSSFVAAASTEIANRLADPTSHQHRD